MEASRRTMRQDRIRTAREHRGHQMPLVREQWMPNCVDTLVDPVESPRRHSFPCHFLVQLRQLPQGNESVLPSGELRYDSIESRPFSPPTG